MWTWLASLLGGPIVNAIIGAYKARLEAQNTTDAQAADLAKAEILGEIEARRAERDILVAEQGHWFTRSVRPLLGIAAAILTWKILVWDLALGQWTHGRTDMLSDQSFWLLTTIIGAYMGGRTLEKVAQVFKR
jgi:hypothetical protein